MQRMMLAGDPHSRSATLPHGHKLGPHDSSSSGAGVGGPRQQQWLPTDRHGSLPSSALSSHKPFLEEEDGHAYEYQEMLAAKPKPDAVPVGSAGLGKAPSVPLPSSSSSSSLPSPPIAKSASLSSQSMRSSSSSSSSLSPPAVAGAAGGRAVRPSLITRQVTFDFDESKFMGEPWYHGNISREEAEKRLREHGVEDGLFLVRNSSHGVSSLAISVAHGEKILHHKLEVSTDGQYLFVGNTRKFPSLAALIDYYCKTPEEEKYRLKRYLKVLSG